MCGIAGLVGEIPADDVAREGARLLRVLAHRGPDDLGWLTYRDGFQRGRGDPPAAPARVALFHRRLSIVDLTEGGWQPMVSRDGRHALVYNGEIYNHVELRAELERDGVTFASRSDSEVLLAAYARWGAACLPRLVGMYAFALLDRTTNRLVLARDGFGIKPLYYARWRHGLAFGSEIKALLDLPGVDRAADPARLYDYLRTGLTDHGDRTMFAAIAQLPAAHHLEVDLARPGDARPVRSWRPAPAARTSSLADSAHQVRVAFLDSVRLHLRSDVPVGAALSGGVDSSSIVAAMRHLEPGLELHAFSYAAEDEAIDETRWATMAGQAARVIPHVTRPTPEELARDLDALIAAQDEPFGSTSIYAQYRVFRLAKEAGIKVMLDGQGADELLAGYRPLLAAALASHVRGGRWASALRLVRGARRLPGTDVRGLVARAVGLLAPAAVQAPLRQLAGRGGFPDWLEASWFRDRGVAPDPHAPGAEPDVLRAQLVDLTWRSSLPMLLRYEDRNSMAHSIESRVPFLTPRLAELILGLPEDHVITDDGTTKAVFREAMRGLVPDPILDRKDKIGFATPERRWLIALSPWVERVLAGEVARALPVLRHDRVAAAWRAVVDGRAGFDFRVWRWLNLIRWVELRGVTL